jgi:hypothetical protein
MSYEMPEISIEQLKNCDDIEKQEENLNLLTTLLCIYILLLFIII